MLILILALTLFALVLQAGRNETRRADLALTVAPAIPPPELAEQIVELHRRGFVSRTLIAGEGGEGLRAQLVERGLREEHIELGASDVGSTAGLRLIARETRAAGMASALVVTPPAEALLGLKVVADQGLFAYAAPIPAEADLPALLRASLNYWQYVLGLA